MAGKQKETQMPERESAFIQAVGPDGKPIKGVFIQRPNYPTTRKPVAVEKKCDHSGHRYTVLTIRPKGLDWLKTCPEHFQQDKQLDPALMSAWESVLPQS